MQLELRQPVSACRNSFLRIPSLDPNVVKWWGLKAYIRLGTVPMQIPDFSVKRWGNNHFLGDFFVQSN